MGVVERRSQLFEQIVRLRRAARRSPLDPDIAAVRSALEEQLGETMSQRQAAQVLGVSHTALGRWVKTGDLPVVRAPSGRVEVPVPAVLDLYDAIEHERQAGRRRRHVIEPSIAAGRNRAQRLRPDHIMSDVSDSDGAGGHGRAERRSLAYHRVVASRLRREMVEEAHHRLVKWRRQGRIDPRYAEQWEAVLRRPLPEIRQVLAEDSPAARDLRQNSPFAGMLSEAERRKILQEIH